MPDRSRQKRTIHVIYAARSLPEIAFGDLFKAYGTKLDIILSDPTTDWAGRKGHLSGELIVELAGRSAEQLIYTSGPEPMTESLEAELLSLGVSSDKLVLDFFPGYPAF